MERAGVYDLYCSQPPGGDQRARGFTFDLQRSIKSAKRDFRDRVESEYHGSDPQRMWSNLCYITDYKGRKSSGVSLSASLPDELNTFYARFEADNTFSAVKIPADTDNLPLVLTTHEVRKAFKRVNGRKAPGPDGVHGRVVRACAIQLADVFTNIFNLSLRLTVIPTCFKQTTIIPVPKKTTVSCLNDYRPVALTSVIMKCFESPQTLSAVRVDAAMSSCVPGVPDLCWQAWDPPVY
ncbi:uncharacterized protein [Misgurnus anguillicaudatus]|uniref:uncharacterized protein n=1 Tax=Misgurnus anguillicaudatus TaxID=75329 RepID=UPI003CCF5244